MHLYPFAAYRNLLATIFNSLLHTSSRDHPSSLCVYDLEDLTTHMWKARFYNGSKGSGLGIAATQNIIYYCGLPNGDDPATNHGLFVLKNHLITSIQEIAKLPTHFSLYQNYPNPFNPSTIIKIDLPKTTDVALKIYNTLGEEVVTLVSDRLSAGNYTYDWDASNLNSGVYLYKLEAGEFLEIEG